MEVCLPYGVILFEQIRGDGREEMNQLIADDQAFVSVVRLVTIAVQPDP